MKVKFTKDKNHTGKIASNRRESAFSNAFIVVALVKGEMREIISVRIYSTNARNYCCVWINSTEKQIHLSGGGFAGGYGYHRPSAALQAALDDAGVILDKDIGGVGDAAMQEALLAVAAALGYKKTKIFQAFA